jgi:hypothetical protein
MKIEGQGFLLRVFLGEEDRWAGKPLHVAVVERARREGLAGATVLRGLLGFGASSRLHTTHVLRLSDDLPMIVEIVDREDRIRAFLPALDEMVRDGMVTLERVEVVTYRAGGAGEARKG